MKSQQSQKGIQAGLPFSLLFVPLMLVGAGLSIPFGMVQRRIRRRRERGFRHAVEARGRIIGWQDFKRALEEAGGTVIEERSSFKGPVRWWWTPESVRDLSPHDSADWLTMLKDDSFRPFTIWCHQRYTSLDQGSAMLVATDGAPRAEVRAFWLRFTDESEHRNFIMVVPPKGLRKA